LQLSKNCTILFPMSSSEFINNLKEFVNKNRKNIGITSIVTTLLFSALLVYRLSRPLEIQSFQIEVGEEFCTKGFFLFPGMYKVDSPDLLVTFQGGSSISSKEVCMKYTSLPQLNKTHYYTMKPFRKKGNVDSDIIFDIMRKLYKKEGFDKIVLVSGDGDYKMLVDFLIEEKLFKKILFPNKKYASSLYKEISANYFAYLDTDTLRKKIGRKKKEKQP